MNNSLSRRLIQCVLQSRKALLVVPFLAVIAAPEVALAQAVSPLADEVDPKVAAKSPTDHVADPYPTRVGIMTGLNQWIVMGGGNLAIQVQTGRLALEYSHGQALNFDRADFLRTAPERDAGVSVKVPWTTGFGVGAMILPNLRVLVEFKAHRFEVRGVDRNDLLAYTTFTVGPGVFYDIYLYKGLFLQPSLRWWPTLGSTLKDGASLKRADGSQYEHQSHSMGPGGFFVNANLGWTI